MKIKAKELRNMSKEQILEKLAEIKKELMKLNSQVAIGTVPEKPGKLKQIKKTVARMLTILSEKQRLPPVTGEVGKGGQKSHE